LVLSENVNCSLFRLNKTELDIVGVDMTIFFKNINNSQQKKGDIKYTPSKQNKHK